jgi:tetratricopeptide (TPR) repeat protein
MKMKYFILALVGLGVSTASFAQKGEVNSAKANYIKYTGLKGAPGAEKLAMPSLTAAKVSVDKATTNEKTQSDPVAWTYKALVYSDLALADSVETTSAPIFTEAVNSYKKATELDKDGANKTLLATVPGLLAQYQFNKGVRAYNAKDFKKASSEFIEGLTFTPTDSVLTLYSGLMALYAKDYPAAIKQYSLALTNKQGNPEVYTTLSELYFNEKDTVNAIKLAAQGAVKYPTNTGLATKEIEYSLIGGKNKEIIDRITEQSKKDPTNKYNPYYLGIAYQGLDDKAKAEEAYKASIAIDPNFADGYLNLGGLIMDNAITIYNSTNKLPASQQAQYVEGMKKANVEFERAFPYIQKSAELNPKSKAAFQHLLIYYQVKKDADKMKEIKAKIEAMP